MNPNRMLADGARHGELRHFKWNWRISRSSDGWMLLWLIVEDTWDADDEDPAWLCAASWQPSMPMVEECVPWIAREFFNRGCRELMQADIAEMCLEVTMREAHEQNEYLDRCNVIALQRALGAP